jgi:hypothetical protein
VSTSPADDTTTPEPKLIAPLADSTRMSTVDDLFRETTVAQFGVPWVKDIVNDTAARATTMA